MVTASSNESNVAVHRLLVSSNTRLLLLSLEHLRLPCQRLQKSSLSQLSMSFPQVSTKVKDLRSGMWPYCEHFHLHMKSMATGLAWKLSHPVRSCGHKDFHFKFSVLGVMVWKL